VTMETVTTDLMTPEEESRLNELRETESCLQAEHHALRQQCSLISAKIAAVIADRSVANHARCSYEYQLIREGKLVHSRVQSSEETVSRAAG